MDIPTLKYALSFKSLSSMYHIYNKPACLIIAAIILYFIYMVNWLENNNLSQWEHLPF